MFGLNLWARPFLHPASQNTQGLDVTSSYLPNPLASPALMVLASTAGAESASRDTAQHPSVSSGLPSSRSSLEKEAGMHPFASFPMFRPGAPSLAGLPHPLWRPHLDPATLNLFRSGGPFHGLSGKESDSYPSAFLPTKRHRLDDRSSSPGDGDGSRDGDGGRGSPYHRRPSPAASREGSHSDGMSEHGDRYTPDSSVKDLSKWVSADGQGLACPICQAVLQPGEVQTHLSREIQQLQQLLSEKENKENAPNYKQRAYDDMVIDLSSPKEVSSKSRYDTYLRIKGNREARLAKMRGRRKRYNELAQQMSSPNTSSSLLESSVEKDCGDDEQIDVISCDDPARENGDVTALSPKHDNKRSSSSPISCSVCLEPYSSCLPVTSVQCWHVHCEKCWLKAMDGSKTCPQCNVDTSPSDLRRIFI